MRVYRGGLLVREETPPRLWTRVGTHTGTTGAAKRRTFTRTSRHEEFRKFHQLLISPDLAREPADPAPPRPGWVRAPRGDGKTSPRRRSWWCQDWRRSRRCRGSLAGRFRNKSVFDSCQRLHHSMLDLTYLNPWPVATDALPGRPWLMLSRTVKDRRYGVSDWKDEIVKHTMLRAYRPECRRRASYPVSVSGVWTREDVQQVVAVSRYHAASLVVQSTVSAAAGTFLMLGQRGHVILRWGLM